MYSNSRCRAFSLGDAPEALFVILLEVPFVFFEVRWAEHAFYVYHHVEVPICKNEDRLAVAVTVGSTFS